MTLAISVWQPHATLLARPLPSTGKAPKRYETRGWSTSHRGLIVIHAAKSLEGSHLCMAEPFRSILAELGYMSADQLTYGAALGFADLVAVHRTNDLAGRLSKQERAFGDFGPNRFAWEFDNVRFFKEPIKMRGQQGLWTFEDEYYTSADLKVERG